MQKDFTYHIYSRLIDSFKKTGYAFLPFIDFISNGSDFERCVIIRHDVDRLPKNALKMAHLENNAGIKASYYFRTVDQVYDESIVKMIAILGHEVSYHYEDLSLCKGNYDSAIKNFELNLRKFRKFYPAKTICMHGSPLSRYDNKKIWEKYDYKDFGIIAEPYFDLDFNEVFYITDTGRSWNHSTVSIRDKVNSKFDITIKDTHHLIEKIKNNELPDKIMINVHPHRWFNYGYNWYKELVMQNFKNQFKSLIVRLKDK